MGIYNLGGGGGAPELQAKEATPLITNAQQIIVPDEGYDGLSKVTVNPMPTGTLKTPTVNSIGYVSSGVQTAGYFDTSATSGLQLSTQNGGYIVPTTTNTVAILKGQYALDTIYAKGDSNLVPENIVAGKSIFGVSGSALRYLEYSTSDCTPSLSYGLDCTFSTYIVDKINYITMLRINNNTGDGYIYLMNMGVRSNTFDLIGNTIEFGVNYRAGGNNAMYGGYATLSIRQDIENRMRIYIKTPASGGPVFGGTGTYTCTLYGYA